MRVSLCNAEGQTIEFATAVEPRLARDAALMMLVRRDGLVPGDVLSVEHGDTPAHPSLPDVESAGNVAALAGRLEARARLYHHASPDLAHDLARTARVLRAIRRWVENGVQVA